MLTANIAFLQIQITHQFASNNLHVLSSSWLLLLLFLYYNLIVNIFYSSTFLCSSKRQALVDITSGFPNCKGFRRYLFVQTTMETPEQCAKSVQS